MVQLQTNYPMGMEYGATPQAQMNAAQTLRDMIQINRGNEQVIQQREALAPYAVPAKEADIAKTQAETTEKSAAARQHDIDAAAKQIEAQKTLLDISKSHVEGMQKEFGLLGQQFGGIDLNAAAHDPQTAMKQYSDIYNNAQHFMFIDKNQLTPPDQITPENALSEIGKAKTYATVAGMSLVDQETKKYHDAEVALRQKEIDIKNEANKIDWYKAQHPQTAAALSTQGLNPQQTTLVEQLAKSVLAGKMSPDLSATLSGRDMAKLRPYVQLKIDELEPEFSLSNAKGTQHFWNSDKTQRQLQLMNTVSEQLPVLLAASKEMKRLNIPALDQHGIAALSASGNVDAANYIGANVTSIEDVAKAISGGNAVTNDMLALSKKMIPLGATAAQLDKIIDQINNAVNSRKLATYQMGGIYGKIAAKQDPFLSDEIRQKILSSNYTDTPVQGSKENPYTPTTVQEVEALKPGEWFMNPATGKPLQKHDRKR